MESPAPAPTTTAFESARASCIFRILASKLLFTSTLTDIKNPNSFPQTCATVQLIGSKWKLLIMRNLLTRPWRFNELQKNLEGISQKVLTDSLRSMEADGIITRTVYPEMSPRAEYALSELGESMRPIINAMEQWGTSYKNAMKQQLPLLSSR